MPSGHSHSSHSSSHSSHSSHSHSSHSSSSRSSHSSSSHYGGSISEYSYTSSYRKSDGRTGYTKVYHTRNHYFTYYDDSWIDLNNRVRPKGYYDESNEYYDGIITSSQNGNFIRADCSYCGSSVVLNLDKNSNFNCPNCGAPLKISMDEPIPYNGDNSDNFVNIFTIAVVIFFVLIALVSGRSSRDDDYQPSSYQQYNYTSNESQYGSILYLYKDENGNVTISNKNESNFVLYHDSDYNYYDKETDGYLYFNQEVGGVWQYWWEGISNDYGNYGWMEYDENEECWYVEVSNGNWKPLPSEKVKDYFWHIREKSFNSNVEVVSPQDPEIENTEDVIEYSYDSFDTTDRISTNFCDISGYSIYCEDWNYGKILEEYKSLEEYYSWLNDHYFNVDSIYLQDAEDGTYYAYDLVSEDDLNRTNISARYDRTYDTIYSSRENSVNYTDIPIFEDAENKGNFIARVHNDCGGECSTFLYEQGYWLYWNKNIARKYAGLKTFDNSFKGWLIYVGDTDESKDAWVMINNHGEIYKQIDEKDTKDLYHITEDNNRYRLDYEDYKALLEYNNIKDHNLSDVLRIYGAPWDLIVYDVGNNIYDVEMPRVSLQDNDPIYFATADKESKLYNVSNELDEFQFTLIQPQYGYDFYGKSSSIKVLFQWPPTGDHWYIWSSNGKILYETEDLNEFSWYYDGESIINHLDELHFHIYDESNPVPRFLFEDSEVYKDYESNWMSYSYFH